MSVCQRTTTEATGLTWSCSKIQVFCRHLKSRCSIGTRSSFCRQIRFHTYVYGAGHGTVASVQEEKHKVHPPTTCNVFIGHDLLPSLSLLTNPLFSSFCCCTVHKSVMLSYQKEDDSNHSPEAETSNLHSSMRNGVRVQRCVFHVSAKRAAKL